jgi:hypothetical protein
LKAIWPKHGPKEVIDFCVTIGFDEGQFHNEVASMQKRKAWKLYLEALDSGHYKNSSIFPDEMGPFGLVLYNQIEVAELPAGDGADVVKAEVTPMPARRSTRTATRVDDAPVSFNLSSTDAPASHSPASDSPASDSPNLDPQKRASPFDTSASGSEYEERVKEAKTKDEQVVNLALINFLNALWIHQRRNSEWSLQRKEFKFQSRGNGAVFSARTDGHLGVRNPSGECSGAIIEVKARQRPKDDDYDNIIPMQESCQMSLWILQEPHSHWTMKSSDTSKADGESF